MAFAIFSYPNGGVTTPWFERTLDLYYWSESKDESVDEE